MQTKNDVLPVPIWVQTICKAYQQTTMFATSKEKKYLPVQVVPVYPSTHAHCDDEHIVLASAAVHWVVDEHAIPTTAERNRRKYHKIIISCKPTIRSEALSLAIGGSRRGTGGSGPPPPPLKNHKNIGIFAILVRIP